MDEGSEAPKKIALKVPSLFIKGPSSSQPSASTEEKQETPEQKKPARPMPASMRRKLEEAKQKENSDNASEISSVSSSPSETTRTSRPGPASAKRKLNATPTSGKATDDDDTKSNVSTSSNSQSETKQKSRPMPASARKKLKEDGQGGKVDGENNGIDKESSEMTEKEPNSVKRPMPAFARKRLEEKIKDESDNGLEETSFGENAKEENTVSTPMPASARKKLETVTDEQTDEKMNVTESSTSSRIGSVTKPEETSAKIRRPMPAFAKRKLETASDSEKKDEDVKTDVKMGPQDDSDQEGQTLEGEPGEINSETKEVKKINISLGGIKFPTFSKPMPASAKRKVETEVDKDEKPPNTPLHLDAEQNDHKDSPVRSSRRSRGSTNEFVALGDDKYPCDICGSEFYSLSKKLLHEKSHLEKGADGEDVKIERKTKSTPKSKNKSKDSKSKYKGMTNCPHCSRYFSNWRKLSKHAGVCGRPANFSCQFCDKKLRSPNELAKHEGTHLKTKKDVKLQDFKSEDDNAASPMSHDSKNDDSKSSTKGSVIDKPKPMPRSVKAKIEKDVKEETSESKVMSCDTRSFKRKIAEVLSNLGTSYNKLQSSSEANEESEIESPPRKKTVLSKRSNGESIRGHPMPASVKKKLEDRGRPSPMPSSPTQEDKSRGDVDPLECAVCHRVFTQKANRVRHERTVHSIVHPSQGSEMDTSTSDYEPVTPKAEKIYKEEEEEDDDDGDIQASSTVDLANFNIPSNTKAKCPICSKMILSRLKRHIQQVHKIDIPAGPIGSVKSPIRLSAPKSYKIYKTATNKLKQKFASSTSTTARKPVASLPKVEVEKKPENKVIASTASSDLRCACCNKIFQVNCDFYEHMRMAHARIKRLVTCKLCDHKFSHEEDFFLHIQFKHQELVAGMKQKPESPTKKDSAKLHSDHVREVSTPVTSRTTRKSNAPQEQKSGVRNTTTSKQVSVRISHQDKQLAEDALRRRQASRKPETSNNPSRSTRRNSMKSSTNEPETYEETYHDDDHFDDSEPMEVEESEIAITSTFSQKVSPSKQEKLKPASSDLDAMHCSTCSEVFYSYEALRKHELYFHNVKSTKMCPICGVYPTRLARHLLAHENKTVRCSCVPCHLSFQDFTQLLKHNLEKHPGVNGGELSAPNQPRDEPQTGSQVLTLNATDTYRCLLCRKEFTGGSNARRHIRRTHSEQECEVESLVERVGGEPEKVDQEVEDILEDTNKKLMDPDWDDSDNDAQTETHTVPKPVQPVSILRKSGRPMPASARAKLGQQRDDQVSIHSDAVSDSSKGNSKQGGRPVPASARAKLETQRKLVETPPLSTSSTETKKPSRPMPASVRAKLATQQSTRSDNSNSRDSSVDNSANKPRRPMPASVRAKLGIGKASSTVSSNSDNNSKVNNARSPSPHEVVTIDDDDDDDGPVDDSFAEPDTYLEPTPPSVPTFSIADEIAEHNRAVRMAMGEDNHPVVESGGFSSFYMFQCKLCDKKFDSADETRKHIRRAHSEYNEDHVENMIGQLFDEYANTSRRRKSNVRYNDDYMDDIDDEVIIPRGTSRRPKANAGFPPVPTVSKSKLSSTQNNDSDFKVEYACKWCGTRKDSAANVRRHICKAHPEMYHPEQREQGVVTLEADQDFVVEEPPPPPERQSNPIYVCKICSRCMTVRSSLYMHITRSHPEVGKGNATNFIQELNGNNDNSPVKDKPVEVESPDNSYYCSICSFQTADEMRYVSHYKNHCGVSPYQCQYCSATFDRHHQLNEHLTREHTGAEFLTADETEISMEEVVGSNQISVGTTSKVQIETQKTFSLLRNNSSDSNGHSEVTPKRRAPGPASRKTAAAKKQMPIVNEIPMDTGNSPSPSPPPPPEDDEMESNEQTTSPCETQNEPAVYSYQGDLSSLFPTLGGGPTPGGIDALDDIDGGMSLD